MLFQCLANQNTRKEASQVFVVFLCVHNAFIGRPFISVKIFLGPFRNQHVRIPVNIFSAHGNYFGKERRKEEHVRHRLSRAW